MKTVISTRSLTLFLLFFFCRILLNDTWHILMDVIKIHGRKQPWKKTLLDLSLMFGPEHSRGSERQAWKCINLLSWLSFHCFALLLCVQYFFFFFWIIVILVLLCVAALFFYSVQCEKQTRQNQKMCIFKNNKKQNTAFYSHVFFVLCVFGLS